jgi:hypothetical protein
MLRKFLQEIPSAARQAIQVHLLRSQCSLAWIRFESNVHV